MIFFFILCCVKHESFSYHVYDPLSESDISLCSLRALGPSVHGGELFLILLFYNTFTDNINSYKLSTKLGEKQQINIQQRNLLTVHMISAYLAWPSLWNGKNVCAECGFLCMP